MSVIDFTSTMSYAERKMVTDKASDAYARGDICEGDRLLSTIPLHPEVAKHILKKHGLMYLLRGDFNLSDAERMFGKGWYDAIEYQPV